MDTPAVNSDSVNERIQAMRLTAEASIGSVQAAAEKSAEPLARVVAAYRSLLASTGSRVIRAHALVAQARANDPTNPALITLQGRVIALLTTWAAHANGYSAYERPATDAEKGNAVSVGWAGIIIALAVAGAVIAVSLTGIAWAVVHYKEAQNLSDEVALIERDPSIADQLAKVNQTAPGSAPPDLNPPAGTSGWVWLLGALGVGAAAVFLLPKLGKG